MGNNAQLEAENPIAAEAYAEQAAEEQNLPIPEKKAAEEVPPAKEQTDDNAAKPKKEEGKEVAASDKAAEEGKVKVEMVAKAEEEPLTDEVVSAYAIKHSITPEEAKEEIMADRAVLKNYKTPEEMARAVRYTRSELDKLKSTAEKKATPVFVPLSDEQFAKECKAHIAKDQEKVIDNYRQKYPAKSELMTDEAIIEDLVERGLGEYKIWAEKKSSEVIQTARSKKEQLLAGIADDDRKYVPAVKAVLDATDPRQILDEGFDIEDLLRHARGEKKSYLAAIKAAEERGAQREREGKEILGMKTGGDGKTTVKSKNVAGLNAKQVDFAQSKFPNESPEVAHKYFKEIYEEDLKENPNFVPHS
jgi:predicted transcriptional regulator